GFVIVIQASGLQLVPFSYQRPPRIEIGPWTKENGSLRKMCSMPRHRVFPTRILATRRTSRNRQNPNMPR
ncbi:hypothetical protein COCCADRAFT_92865, partial [Bipolaris zeicola 26-R-13]